MALSRALLVFSLLSTTVLSQTQTLPLGSAPTNSPTTNTSSSEACANLHIIVVRASDEIPSQGVIGTLATLITTANPGSSVEWIPYPATLTNYDTSSYNGTITTTEHLMNYTETCKNAQVVLLGYSQGAQVVGDVMCGGGGAFGLGPSTPPIASNYSDRVVAMIQMGDPRHMVNHTFDVGTATLDGLFPRPNNISCDPYASKIQSYCDAGDPFCASGNNLTVHLSYDSEHNQDAFNFVQSKIKAASTSSSSSTSSGASATATGAKSTGATLPPRESMAGLTMAFVFATIGGVFLFAL